MRTVRNVSSLLLPLAIAALAAGCSRNASQARSAGSPTFESSVPSSGQGGPGVGGSSYGSSDQAQGSAQGGPGVSAMGSEGNRGEGQRDPETWNYSRLHPVESDRARPDRTGQGTAGGADQAQQGSAAGQTATGEAGTRSGDLGQAQQGSGTTGQAAGATSMGDADIDPNQICTALKQADFQVQDIPGGVSIVLSPKPDQGYASLRSNVSSLVSQSDVSSSDQGGQAGAQCPLFQLAHDGTVATTMKETPGGIELSFTSVGDGIGKVRNQVHGFFHGAGNQGQQNR